MTDIIICDDREEILTDLKEKIKAADVQGAHRILAYNNGKNMLDDLEDNQFSEGIFILDIDLGGCENGITLADKISERLPDAQIIFMSGYDDYYEDVYDVSHIYFLQKPVRKEALTKALAIAHKHLLEAKQNCFYVENKSGRFVVPFKQIFLFEKDKRRIVVRGRKGEEICGFYGRFGDIEDNLPDHFHRCHNSFIVNLSKVRTLSGSEFVLFDGRQVRVSRAYIQDSRIAYARYIDNMLHFGR